MIKWGFCLKIQFLFYNYNKFSYKYITFCRIENLKKLYIQFLIRNNDVVTFLQKLFPKLDTPIKRVTTLPTNICVSNLVKIELQTDHSHTKKVRMFRQFWSSNIHTFYIFLLSFDVFISTFMVNYLFCIFRIFWEKSITESISSTTSNATLKMRRYLFDFTAYPNTFYVFFRHLATHLKLFNLYFKLNSNKSFIRVL